VRVAVRTGTYSIVARDPATGELGVAVQSHWFSVGSLVSWAEPGVGAVATQANVDPAYGPRTLALIRVGVTAPDALARLLEADPEADVRQVAAIDASGRVAVHTGAGCIPYAGDASGDDFSCQANMMGSEAVWGAMADAFRRAEGPLTHRLLAALDAGEGAGGDVRGRQSAALLVVGRTGEPWERTVELRIEDHADPLAELRRLVRLSEAYAEAGEGDRLVGEGRHREAAARYIRAAELVPDNHELMFWAGLGTALAGDVDGGAERVAAAIALEPGWGELLPRLTPDTAPSAAAVLARLRDR
jgi:uncharacterized Ntn-hydrolase superfamily protein